MYVWNRRKSFITRKNICRCFTIRKNLLIAVEAIFFLIRTDCTFFVAWRLRDEV